MLIFPNNKTNNTKKKQKYFFNFLGPTKIDLDLPIFIQNNKSWLSSSLKIFEKKTIEKII